MSHRLIEDVYIDNYSNTLYTKNLVHAQAPLNDDEVVISIKDSNGTIVEYREWNTCKLKLVAPILCNAQNIWIEHGSCVLVIYSGDDEKFGSTISHISDLVGSRGMVYIVEPSNWKTLAKIMEKWCNNVPIIHVSTSWHYHMLINIVDVLFSASNRPEEFQAAYLNVMYFLEAGGHSMLYVKANCIESTRLGNALFSSLCKQKVIQFKRMEQVTLEPFDKDHGYIIGALYMPKMV